MSAISLTASAHRPDVGEAPPSYLAPDLMVRGRILCRGTVEIDCEMDGDIDANNLIIGPEGRCRATVLANDTVVSGTFEGLIKSRCVTFTDGCEFDGDVQYEALGMEPNADVRGAMFPVLDGNARTALADQAHSRQQVIRSHSAERRSPLLHHTGEHHVTTDDRSKHSPVRHTLLGVVAFLALLVVLGIGLMVTNPNAHDWQSALLSTLAEPSAPPAPEPPKASSPASDTAADTTAAPQSPQVPPTAAPLPQGSSQPTVAAAQADDPPLSPPRTMLNGVLLPVNKPEAPQKQAAIDKAAAEKAAAEKIAAEKAATEKAAAEKLAAEKAATEKAAAEKIAAEKAATEKAAAEKLAAEKAATEKAAAEKIAAEKAATEKAAAEKLAAEKAATEKAAAEKIAAEKAATPPKRAASSGPPARQRAGGESRQNNENACSWVLQCDGPGDSNCISVRQCDGSN